MVSNSPTLPSTVYIYLFWKGSRGRGLGRTVGDCKQIGVGVGPAHQPPPTCNFWLRPWPIGVKFCMMVHIGPGQVFFPFGGGTQRGTPKIPNVAPKFWPLNREYIENSKSCQCQCQLELNISSMGDVRHGESILSKKYVASWAFLSIFCSSLCDQHEIDWCVADHASLDSCLSRNSTTLRYAMAVLFSGDRRAASIAILSHITCIRRRR